MILYVFFIDGQFYDLGLGYFTSIFLSNCKSMQQNCKSAFHHLSTEPILHHKELIKKKTLYYNSQYIIYTSACYFQTGL